MPTAYAQKVDAVKVSVNFEFVFAFYNITISKGGGQRSKLVRHLVFAVLIDSFSLDETN